MWGVSLLCCANLKQQKKSASTWGMNSLFRSGLPPCFCLTLVLRDRKKAHSEPKVEIWTSHEPQKLFSADINTIQTLEESHPAIQQGRQADRRSFSFIPPVFYTNFSRFLYCIFSTLLFFPLYVCAECPPSLPCSWCISACLSGIS